MTHRIATAAFFVGLFAGSSLLLAHHSVSAGVDMTRTVRVTGKIVKVEWRNPHVRITVHGTDDQGKVADWLVEGGSVVGLSNEGIRPNVVTVGDVVSIEGHPAKEETRLMVSGLTVILPDGRKLDIHDRWGENMIQPTLPQPPASQR
jgi:hypothetical protein